MESQAQASHDLDKDERVIADIHDQRKLVCVEVPGIVENDERAISCLGGINAISKAHYDGNQNLEMKFRPEDRYCRPTVAREEKVTNLVLRVRRRRRQKDDDAASVSGGGGDSQYSAELLGIVNSSYHFPGMADYQVLPPGLNNSSFPGMPVDPKDFQLSEPLDDGFVDRDLPTFLPPSSFTKFDKPFNYLSPKAAVLTEDQGTSSDGQSSVNKVRPKRVHNIYGFLCSHKGKIPTEPHPQAFGIPHVDHPKIQELKDLFEERPVWSRSALQYRVKIPQTFLRCLLSVLCYKFLSMPFKNLWVKFGYDPRLDPASKIYQAIDYRVPQDVLQMIPESRRGARGLESASLTHVVEGSDQEESISPSQNLSINKQADITEEMSFTFHPDKLPAQRQVIYQLCDIKDDEVQALIHKNDGDDTEFKEPNGWCEENTYEQIRKILTAKVRKLCGHTPTTGKVSAINRGSPEKKTKTSKQKATKSSK